jgi:hypothetical protein
MGFVNDDSIENNAGKDTLVSKHHLIAGQEHMKFVCPVAVV